MDSNSQKKYKGTSLREYSSKKTVHFDPEAEVEKIMRNIGVPVYNEDGSSNAKPSSAHLSVADRAMMAEEIRRQIAKFQQGVAEEQNYQNYSGENNGIHNKTNKTINKTNGKRRLTKRGKATLAALVAVLGISIAKPTIGGSKGDINIETTNAFQTITDESTEVNSEMQVQEANDKISYVVDFCDYANPGAVQNINSFAKANEVSTFAFKCGGSTYDYPFAIVSFDDPEIKEQMSKYSDIHVYDSLGKIENMEAYMRSVDNTMLYYYTCCTNNQEAEIEAECIKATLDKLKKDMPDYDFSERMCPIAIDIEYCGDEKEKVGYSWDQQNYAKSQRTDAILHLIDKLVENGAVDDRGVIIYGDLNRMREGSHVEWDRFFETLKQKNMNVTKWGTRAIEETYDSGIVYNDAGDFMNNLMNNNKNITYMKNNYQNLQQYIQDIAIQQIHLDQRVQNSYWGEVYDVSITTEQTIKDIIKGKEINYKDGFINKLDNIEMKKVSDDLKKGASEKENTINEDNDIELGW